MADASMDREWRVVESFFDYEVSDQGLIRRLCDHPRHWRAFPKGYVVPQWRIAHDVMKKDGSLTDLGRMAVSLYNPITKISANVLVSRIVCYAFHGEPPSSKHHAAHNDGDAYNNEKSNLRWATATENQADRNTHGTDNRGSKHGMSKLTDAEVFAIRQRCKAGERDIDLAEDYAVSRTTIHGIRTEKTWRHIGSSKGSADRAADVQGMLRTAISNGVPASPKRAR